MRIIADGKVGIGIDTPTKELDILGNLKLNEVSGINKIPFYFSDYTAINLIGTTGGIKLTGDSDYIGIPNYSKTNTGYNNKTIEQELSISPILNYADLNSSTNISFIVLNDGSVKGWGENNRRQLGDGSNTNRTTMVDCTTWNTLNSGGNKIVRMISRYSSSHALLNTGALYFIGINWADDKWPGGQYVSSGNYFTLTLVKANNSNSFDGSTDALHVVDVLASNLTTYIITKDGHAKGWGSGANNQLSNGSSSGTFGYVSPIQTDSSGGVLTGCATRGFSVPSTTVTIAYCGYSVIMLKSDQTLVGWGRNYVGILGTGNADTITRATALTLPSGVKVKSLAQQCDSGYSRVMGYISTNNELY